MPLANVRRFAKRVIEEPEFRKRMTIAEDQAAREAILAAEGLDFTDAEFEDEFGAMHAGCQTQLDADHLQEFRLWWELVRNS